MYFAVSHLCFLSHIFLLRHLNADEYIHIFIIWRSLQKCFSYILVHYWITLWFSLIDRETIRFPEPVFANIYNHVFSYFRESFFHAKGAVTAAMLSSVRPHAKDSYRLRSSPGSPFPRILQARMTGGRHAFSPAHGDSSKPAGPHLSNEDCSSTRSSIRVLQ